MIKATMSFEKKRAALLQRMAPKAQGQAKVVHFANDDVPKFLKRLDRFESESRKSRLVAK